MVYSGTELVAEHASRNLQRLFAKRPEFDEGDYAEAIKAALSDEDGLLLESFKYETAEPAISGSTVAICFINLTKGELIVSNLGDSHVILAERDPQTEYPYHIVCNGSPPPSIRKQMPRRLTSHTSDDSPRHTNPGCQANEPGSRKPGERSNCVTGFLGSVSGSIPLGWRRIKS